MIVLAVIAIGGIVGWTYINKPTEKVEDVKAMTTTAEDLNNSFTTNEADANKKYLKKAIEVSGTVAEISKNQDGKTVLLLQSDDPMGGIQCTLRDNEKVDTGKQVTVKGFCTGYTMVVLLSDCILL